MEARRYIPHYSTAEYEQWEGDWELWNGVAVSMSPSPTFGHQEVNARLVRALGNQLDHAGCKCRLVVEHDWRITDDLVVRPDLSVVCRPVTGDFLTVPPTLVAEVLSPATEDKDRHAKRDLYAEQGVKHYLLVDPDSGVIEALTRSDDTGDYVSLDSADAKLELHAGCTVTLSTSGWAAGPA